MHELHADALDSACRPLYPCFMTIDKDECLWYGAIIIANSL